MAMLSEEAIGAELAPQSNALDPQCAIRVTGLGKAYRRYARQLDFFREIITGYAEAHRALGIG